MWHGQRQVAHFRRSSESDKLISLENTAKPTIPRQLKCKTNRRNSLEPLDIEGDGSAFPLGRAVTYDKLTSCTACHLCWIFQSGICLGNGGAGQPLAPHRMHFRKRKASWLLSYSARRLIWNEKVCHAFVSVRCLPHTLGICGPLLMQFLHSTAAPPRIIATGPRHTM